MMNAVAVIVLFLVALPAAPARTSSDFGKAEALALSRAQDLLLAQVAFGVEREDLGGSSSRADHAVWKLAFAPSRFWIEHSQSPGAGDGPDLAVPAFSVLSETDHFTVWHPTLQRAQIHGYGSGDMPAERAFMPWQSNLPYLLFLPPASRGISWLGLTSLLTEPESVLEPVSDAGEATHRLVAPATGRRPEVMVWIDFTEGAVITRYRMHGREARATSFVDVGPVRLPASVVNSSVDAWAQFDAAGDFPPEAEVLRFRLITDSDGHPDVLLGDAVADRFRAAADAMPPETRVFDMTLGVLSNNVELPARPTPLFRLLIAGVAVLVAVAICAAWWFMTGRRSSAMPPLG